MQIKTTKELLAESFKELAANRPINKITIAAIAVNCGVTPPTFYRYFKDKYDLIAWIYLADSQRFLGRIGEDGYTWRDAVRDGLRYFAENRIYAVNALKHTSGQDSFIAQKTRTDMERIVRLVQNKLMTERIPDTLMETLKLYLYGAEFYLCEWLVGDMPVDWEKVAEVMEASVPDLLRPYLFP